MDKFIKKNFVATLNLGNTRPGIGCLDNQYPVFSLKMQKLFNIYVI